MDSFSKAYRRISGRIVYVSDAAHDNGRPRGEERFTVTVHDDGRKILRATCHIADPPHIVRDVVQTVDAHMQPIECLVQVRTGGSFTGSGVFRWQDGIATVESETVAEGRVRQQLAYAHASYGFCNHAIVGDAWMAANCPVDRAGRSFALAQMFTPSLNKQGATGPILARSRLDIQYRGRECLTVAAGAFDTLSFRFAGPDEPERSDPDHPHYEMWTTDDGCFIPVCSMYKGQRRYELVDLVYG